MTKGGARTRSGPAPDPDALRRERDGAEWNELPADGRAEPAPDFPLPRPTRRERAMWERLWSMPQAVMWERFNQHELLALYVRRFSEAEKRGSAATLSNLVRQMADALGLTTAGLRANRWLIVAGRPAMAAPTPTQRHEASARNRFRVVGGNGS